MKGKYLKRRIVAFIVALTLIVTGVGAYTYAGSDSIALKSKGTLSTTDMVSGTSEFENSFGNHSAQELKIKPSVLGYKLDAFCVAPGVKIIKNSNAYVASSHSLGNCSKYYRGAMMYFHYSDKGDAERLATQLWCWQIYKADKKYKKTPTGSQVASATSGFKSLFIKTLSGKIDGSLKYDSVSKSKATDIYNELYDYIVNEGSKDAFSKNIELTKWTASGAQNVVTYEFTEDKIVRINIEKKVIDTEGVELKDADLYGFEFGVFTDKACTKYVKNAKGKNLILKTNKNGIASSGDINFTGDDISTLYVKEVGTKGLKPQVEVKEISIKNTSATYNIDYTNICTPTHVTVTKIDPLQKDKKLIGAEFTLYRKNGTVLTQIAKSVDNKNGTYSFNIDLYPTSQGNTFLVKETKTPPDDGGGYYTGRFTEEFTVTGKGGKVSFTAKNTLMRPGRIDIIKKDGVTGEVLTGAEFFFRVRSYKIEENKLMFDNKYGPFKEDYPGHYYLDLTPQQMASITLDETVQNIVSLDKRVLETKAPKGYYGIQNAERYDCEELKVVTKDNPIVSKDLNFTTVNNKLEFEILNYPITGHLKLVKKDSKTGERVPGATYRIYEVNNDGTYDFESEDNPPKLIGEETTDENGELIFTGLYQTKKYVIFESEAPKGYTLNKEPIPVNDLADIPFLDYWTLVNKYNKDGEFDKDKAIADGFAIFSEKEYTKNGEVTDFEKVVNTEDTMIKAPIRINKMGANAKGEEIPLNNAKFNIYDTSTLTGWDEETMESFDYSKFEPVDSVETKDNGVAETKELTYGKYVCVEVKAPKNYLKALPQVVDIDESCVVEGSVKEVDFFDDYLTARVKIIKKDAETGDLVTASGSTFKVYDKQNDQYLEFKNLVVTEGSEESEEGYETDYEITDTVTTGKDGYVIIPQELPAGKYVLEEVKASDGYKLNDEKLEFEIDEDTLSYYDADIAANVVEVEYVNYSKKGSIVATKRGEVVSGFKDGDFTYDYADLEGAEFGIYANEDILKVSDKKTVLYAKDELVKKITTGKDGKGTADELFPGLYYVKELKSPDGHSLSDKKYELELKENDNGEIQAEVTVKNDRQGLVVKVLKVDDETDKPLPGAEFSAYAKEDVFDRNGNLVVSKDTLIETQESGSDGNALFVKNYPVGMQLYIKETRPPHGYTTSSKVLDVVFEDPDDTVQTLVKEYKFGDQPKSVEVSKYDITNSEELPGNHLKVVYEEDGKEKTFDSWVSGEKPHKIKYLTVNKKYTLVETQPADGYTTAENIDFVVKDNNEVDAVKMYNEPTKLQIKKTDITTGEPVVGARLQIINSNNEIVKDFVTTDNAEDMYFEKLPIGSYILRELLPPAKSGYVKAEDIKFEIKDDRENVQQVEMKDDYTKVVFEKIDATDGEGVVGAVLTLYDADGKEVEHWETDGKPHQIDYLPEGNYKLVETTVPDGYYKADDMDIVVNSTGEKQTFTMEDERLQVQVVFKKADSATGEFLAGAIYTLTDQTTGEEVASIKTNSEGVGASKLIDLCYYENGKLLSDRTLILKEKKAPSGWKIDKTEYVIKLSHDKDQQGVVVYDAGTKTDEKKTISIVPLTGDYFNSFIPILLAILVLSGTSLSIAYDKKKRLLIEK